MSQQHPIGDFTSASLESLRSLVDVNTIVGEPITSADGVVIIPISKVSFGYASGGSDLPTGKQAELFGGATGGGVTIQPLAFLVISGGKVELLQMQSANNTADRIVNAVPGVIDKLIATFKKDKSAEECEPQGKE
ncbi:MAG: GerW family sporulation protein [Oscillospiraceae bacterium]|jgi:sporulation protein YtfJ|nr:GerW family sporulation protein [Oscillospiraceae bacterium]